MDKPDFPALYQSILRCDAAYGDPSTLVATFEALGSTAVKFLSSDNVQAVMHVASDGVLELTNTGTRFSEGPIRDRIGDLLQDAEFRPMANGFAGGAYLRAKETWEWALPFVDGRPIRVVGHSLGAWEACAAPQFVSIEQIVAIHAWESPKPATAAYWAANPAIIDKLLMLLHEQDPWWHYPFRIFGDCGLRHTPEENTAKTILWIRNGSWEMAAENGVAGGDLIDAGDHGPSSVISAVAALAVA
jgi:hypothetical protein